MATTDSGHDLRVYLNLAGRMELIAIDQLWAADMTYLRLAEEFVYLAVVLDAFRCKSKSGGGAGMTPTPPKASVR